MTTLTKVPGGLLISPDDTDAIADLEPGPRRAELDALEPHLCNGWTLIDPADVGALTDGLIITDDAEHDFDGQLMRVGTVYWDAEYAVRSLVAELQAGRPVRLVACP